MYYPTLDEVKKLKNQGNLMPIYREIVADLETPVSAYLKVASDNPSFLLESVEGGEHLARYSFVGTEPYLVLKTTSQDKGKAVDPLLAVETELNKYKLVSIPGLPRFYGGAVGYLAYETVRHFEKIPTSVADPLGLPESVFLFVDTLLIFDHLTHKIRAVSHVRLDGDIDKAYFEATRRIDRLVERLQKPLSLEIYGNIRQSPISEFPISSNFSPPEFEAIVTRAKEYIYAGDVIQVVLSQLLARRTNAKPFDIYRALRTVNPSPYMYFLDLGSYQIIGASPEMLVRVEDGIVANHPIAGTRPRGKDATEDAMLEAQLCHDEKERAEHIMLVDLSRNDVGRVSEPGTVEVTELMNVERYSHVMHLVSHVQGKLRRGLSPFDALRACFPAGTVSGAPKIRAMEIIAELEGNKRGPYAGAVGYFGFSGNLDTAITIRTIVLTGGTAYVQVGAGIVADSIEAKEYQETMNKAQALLKAIEQAEKSYG